MLDTTLMNFIANTLMYFYLLPLRLIGIVSERMLGPGRPNGWNTSFSAQLRLAIANSMALRQAELFNAYPIAAHRATGTLRFFGLR